MRSTIADNTPPADRSALIRSDGTLAMKPWIREMRAPTLPPSASTECAAVFAEPARALTTTAVIERSAPAFMPTNAASATSAARSVVTRRIRLPSSQRIP